MDTLMLSPVWQVVGTIVTVLSFIGGILLFCIIKFNDVSHLDKKLDKLIGNQEEQFKSIADLRVDLATVKSKEDTMSVFLRVLEKSLDKA